MAQRWKINQDPDECLKGIRVFALDMDGTIYLGEQWIDGAKTFLQKVQEVGKDYYFLTNNSSKNAAMYVEKLHRMGLDIGEEKIITSGQATIFYLTQHFPEKKVYLLGNPLLQEEFQKGGIPLSGTSPDVVVVGFDTTMDYRKMCQVCDYVRDGLPYLTTHPDLNCPTETGFIPDAGAIHAFIHASTGRWPDRVIGKPNEAIIAYTMDRIRRHQPAGSVKIRRDQVAMVGDRLYTDVAAGVNNGLTGILVLSGEAGMREVEESDVKPDLIFDGIKDLAQWI